jgi:hypothetical protein
MGVVLDGVVLAGHKGIILDGVVLAGVVLAGHKGIILAGANTSWWSLREGV